jgi:hypothetical protein
LAAEERGGAHKKASLWWRGSAAGKRRRQARIGVTGGVRAVGEDVLGGAVLGVGSRWLEDGWSGLFAVAQFGRRGTTVVERRSSRWRRQGGRGSSRHWCGARGGDEEFGGGPKQCFIVAQCRRHDGTVVAMSGGGKGQLTGRALLLKAARGGGRGRQKRWAGRRVGAAGEAVGGQGGGRRPNAVGMAAPLFRPCGGRVGPRGFIFYQIIQTGLNLEIGNGCLNVLQKFPIFSCSYIGTL